MKSRQVAFLPLLAGVAFCSAMIGLLIEDREAQMLALLGVLLTSALVKNWIEYR